MATDRPNDDLAKQRIVEYLERVPFDRAIEQSEFRDLLRRDAESEHPLYTHETIAALEEAREVRHAKRLSFTPSAFFNNKSVLIVPGFLGSQLRDVGANSGLIWINPLLYFNGDRFADLMLNAEDEDSTSGVDIRADGPLPILYSGLRYYLETGRCEARITGFDWRKNIDDSAAILIETIRGFAAEHPGRPFFLIAHSQGSLVARRALQRMGKDEARRLITRLILLGPASYGTFSAASAIAGNHETVQALADLGLRWPDNFSAVLQSMSGLYQLLPWKEGTVDMSPDQLAKVDFWKSGVDGDRLKTLFRWGENLDTDFFNDRTSIILGNQPETATAVDFDGDVLKITKFTREGDGTVPDKCAIIDGVADVSRATGAEHMNLPLTHSVMQAVWRVISSSMTLGTLPSNTMIATAPKRSSREPIAVLPTPAKDSLYLLVGVRKRPADGSRAKAATVRAKERTGTLAEKKPIVFRDVPKPPHRRLRVFSFDPLLANDPASLGIESIVLKLDWDEESADGPKLQPGPVGEYLEVVDFDPATGCFYPPVDLNHPNLLAQDGMPLSETDPRFHQQMVYAVAMTTISIFERALGRQMLWSPYLPRDERGDVIHDWGGRADGEFVRRLRIYPHAMRDANAFYDPTRKALLFGYFPAQATKGGRVLPRGIVFTCLSYDVIAHETTHALLDGMHRYLLDASNSDILAFHEAFADIVALFQHFSHPEVLRFEVARAGGDLQKESLLGQLAQEFGEAMGMHRSLRNYLGESREKKNGEIVWEPKTPDPTLYGTVLEPHDRGAILVAAMFTAFLTIYRKRTRDLMRIASDGTGIIRPGDLPPDLVNRLAAEAAKVAKNLLVMAIRALDYVPPVDMTFGDYLRGLITSDYDVFPGEHQLYRVSVLDAFRQWGIYPKGVRQLSINSLIWDEPGPETRSLDMAIFREIVACDNGSLNVDRATIYANQSHYRARLHEAFARQFQANPKLEKEWGLSVSENAPHSIRRNAKGDVVFEVHSVRRCRRIGPDSQERVDVLVEVVQKRRGFIDPGQQARVDAGELPNEEPDFIFRGGVTLIVDPRAGRVRYAIRKNVTSSSRFDEARHFHSGHGGSLGLASNYFTRNPNNPGNPFAMLHAGEE